MENRTSSAIPCGTQIFIRREQGRENLSDLIRTLKSRDIPFREHARVLYEIQSILVELRGIKKEMKSLDSVFELLSKDKDKQRTRKLLRKRIDRLFVQLEEIACS